MLKWGEQYLFSACARNSFHATTLSSVRLCMYDFHHSLATLQSCKMAIFAFASSEKSRKAKKSSSSSIHASKSSPVFFMPSTLLSLAFLKTCFIATSPASSSSSLSFFLFRFVFPDADPRSTQIPPLSDSSLSPFLSLLRSSLSRRIRSAYSFNCCS